MKKNVPYIDKLKSIKFTNFILVFIAACVYLPLGYIDGAQFVALMVLSTSIFAAAHEHTKRLEALNGKPPTE